MQHKFKRKILIIFFTLLFLMIVYRHIYVLTGNICTGEYRKSPDGVYQADVMDCYSESFFGQKKQWFEFKIIGNNQTQKFTTSPITKIFFGSRAGNQVVYWEPDSSAVKFVFPEMEVKVKVQK